uniref:RNB domain-containing protein n=1 Tax=viral metagenome TaxID=1070528 RepID=A0A6C0D445_9ZZZZ
MLLNTNIKILVTDRQYSDWTFVDYQNDNQILDRELYPVLKTIDPIKERLFSRDIFSLDINGSLKLEHSYIKSCDGLAGLLVLEGNKTYGRTANKKRLLYKCIPDDKRLPIFLVPYDLKIGFSKVYKNKFIVFRFDSWSSEHPLGQITETLGDVDNLEVFYEYQLYCKSLHDSLTDFTNKTRKVLNEKSTEEYVEQILQNDNYQIEDRRNTYIFTIDPNNSTDLDDGFSIEVLPDNKGYKVSVYIANLFFWIETLGLWNSFSRRVSTIYLPDRRRPMLPTILSDTLCSLLENQPRFTLALDFMIDNDGNIIKTDLPLYCKNVLISVNKNYTYEEPALLKNRYYRELFDISKKNSKSVKNSHDLVSFWMIQMNKTMGEYMAFQGIGIFRAAAFLSSPSTVMQGNDFSGLNEDVTRIIQTWNNTTGQYLLFKEGLSLNHEIMSTQSYIHITSPIRRLVDLLNQMILFRHISMVKTMSPDASQFIEKWTEQMDYINTAMRCIRKIQTDCEVLNRCFTTPDIMTVEHDGVLFDKIVKNDGTIHYMVYLEKLKMLSRITTHIDLPNHTYQKFRIFLFEDEDKSKKKIRLQII